jgi:hypothetical protein
VANDKIEREEIEDLPQGKAKAADKQPAELTPEELDKVAGGVVVTHIPGNPI